MRFRSALLAALLMWLCPAARAQPIDSSVFSVATLQPTARGAALGGASAALPSVGVVSFLENPAHLRPDAHNQIELSLLNHVSSLKTGTVAYGRDYPDLASFGVALRFLGWGDITRANQAGETSGTFSAGEFALTVGGARPLTERVRYGASLHWLHSGIDGQAASALALDAGILRYDPESRLGLSASVHNLGVVLSNLGETGDELPLDLRLAVSKRLRHLPLLVSLTAWDLTDFSAGPGSPTGADRLFHHLRLGGEFQFSDAFRVRFGYDHRRHSALRIKSRLDLAGVSFGTGIKVRRVRVDYSYNSWSSLGGLHQFSVATGL